jgi:hypothetical protein
MQRYARASDLFDQGLTACVDFVQVRRTKWLVSRPRKDDVAHLEIAHRTVVRRCKRVEFFGDAERCLANFIIRTNVSDEDWINCIAENHERVIAHFDRIGATGKRARYYDERIGRADQKTELFQRANFRAQLRDCVAQVALTRGRGTCQRELFFCPC